MNAPLHPTFASILANICPPVAAPKQPEVSGEYLCTVTYDGLALDVYGDGDGDYSGIALKGSKVCLCCVMADAAIDQIERMAAEKMRH